MKKHEILENIRIEKLIFGGAGLAVTPDGRKIIISGGAIPDAVVDIRITKVKKTHYEGQIARIVKKSPHERPLPTGWQMYGGVKWLAIPYQKQLEIKEQQIKEAFHPIRSALENTQFHPIVPSPETEHYRNKLEFSWGKYISAREGVHEEYRFGFHVQGQFDRIEDCQYCILASDAVNAIFRDIDDFARKSGLPTYDAKMGHGFWRHLVVREAKKSGEIMLILSCNVLLGESPKEKKILEDLTYLLTRTYPHIVSVFVLENTLRADIVQGNPVLLFGRETLIDEILGYSFEIRPKSFFQVNTLAAEGLYSIAMDAIQSTGGILLDLYAGTGTIGILLAKHFSHVYSVELVESASRDGIENARRNTVQNMTFIQAKVEDFARDFRDKNGVADTIILDPPRDGLHPSALPNILSFGAREIIYVSCNPSTLVRDLEKFLSVETENAPHYRISDVFPVDMFPHTHHIETVVRLEKVEK